MSKNQAVVKVIEYIIENELYNFKSLSEKAQERLMNAYGANFGEQVNKGLGFSGF